VKLKYFCIAKKLAEKSSYHHKLGAVVVFKNKIIGLGFNKPSKTHTRANTPFNTIHAELDAILQAGDQCRNAEIYVYREYKNGSPANAKPCKYCEELIRLVGIKKVYYTDEGKYKSYSIRDLCEK
jgi:deoxycytidylate deaminase